MPPSAQNYGKSSAGKNFVDGFYKKRGIDPGTVFQNTNETARKNKVLDKAVSAYQAGQPYRDQANSLVSKIALNTPTKSQVFDFGKMLYQMGKETVASFGDVIQRAAPLPIPGAPFTLEQARNTISGVRSVVTGDRNVPSGVRFEQGFQESKGRKTNFEKVSGKDLTKQDGSIDWKVGREFIGRAMEAPTYVYAGAAQVGKEMGLGLARRIVTRTARSLPEAGINTGIQTFEEGSTENVGINLLANTLLLSGVSNIAGEFKVSKKVYKEAIDSIQRELGVKLSPEEQADIVLAINQKISPETIITNMRRIREGEVTPEELAETINKNYVEPDIEDVSKPSTKTSEKSEPKADEVPEKWYRGVDEENVNPKSGDRFYSANRKTAEGFGKVEEIPGSQSPKKPLVIDDKDTLAKESNWMKQDPKTAGSFDDFAKKYAQDKGYDGIIYRYGQDGEKELHAFKPTSEPKVEVAPKTENPPKPSIQPAIEGTGDLVERGAARSLRDRAVAEGMDDFDVPSYRQMDMKEKAKKANDMMDTDPERVRRIAMRQEEAPAGDPPEAYFLAMENQILGSKNPETMVSDIIELSQSRIIEEATAMGQRNAMWAARAETSPTAIINKLTKERTGKAVKSVKKEVDEMRKAVRKTVKTAFNVDAAQKLLDKLKC